MLLALLLAAAPALEPLAPGVEYAQRDGLHVVRIDPSRVTLQVGLASQHQSERRTAAEWADAMGFTVTINAGMFKLEDGVSNVGHLHTGAHVNSRGFNEYKSVLALSKGKAAIIDLDAEGARGSLGSWDTVIQNLRLIRGPGVPVWKPNGRKWSEAAVASDDQGRLLFFFSRAPLMMSDFNAKVLGLGLGVQRAMHVEGGPEASLSIRTPTLRLDLCGSYETGFVENDDNHEQWPIPNVIGVVAPAQ